MQGFIIIIIITHLLHENKSQGLAKWVVWSAKNVLLSAMRSLQ